MFRELFLSGRDSGQGVLLRLCISRQEEGREGGVNTPTTHRTTSEWIKHLMEIDCEQSERDKWVWHLQVHLPSYSYLQFTFLSFVFLLSLLRFSISVTLSTAGHHVTLPHTWSGPPGGGAML